MRSVPLPWTGTDCASPSCGALKTGRCSELDTPLPPTPPPPVENVQDIGGEERRTGIFCDRNSQQHKQREISPDFLQQSDFPKLHSFTELFVTYIVKPHFTTEYLFVMYYIYQE